MANLWWATHDGVSHESLSLGDKCEWTRWSSSSKHSAASPRQPKGKRRLAKGPLARALRSGSGQSAGSELVWSCVKRFWKGISLLVQDFISMSIESIEKSRLQQRHECTNSIALGSDDRNCYSSSRISASRGCRLNCWHASVAQISPLYLHFLSSSYRDSSLIEALVRTLCACNGTWSFSIVLHSNFSN